MNGHFESCVTPHDCWCEVKLYGAIFCLGIGILVIQIGGGILSGSLALFADSGHVAGDNAALASTLLTAYLVKKHRHHERVIRVIGGYANALFMLTVGIWVLVEWLEGWQKPVHIESLVLIGFAALGGMGNWLQHEIVSRAEHLEHTVTAKSIKTHIWSDLWQSVAVVLGGGVMDYTEWFRIDVVLSLIIALFMFYWAAKIFW